MPHKEEQNTTEFTPDLYPPFPPDIPTVELQTISLTKLLAGDAVEQNRVFSACVGRGFFYLDLGGCQVGETIRNGAEQIALVGERVFQLPLDEKLKYRMGGKVLFGYKSAGATVTDKAGTPDTAEFFNVGKNDMIVPDDKMNRPWPAPVLEAKPLFADYVKSAHSVGMRILSILADRLGVDPAEITGRHRIEEHSGDHVRITRGPPRATEEMPEIQTPSHTDFGTITILMNWLGGLQVWSESSRKAQVGDLHPEGAGEWLWVKPKRGCAIINLGDAAVRFTNGILCSGRHRVIPSPGAQGRWPRYSIVYFVRPEDECLMSTLQGKGIPESSKADEGLTAREWIFRQATALGNRLDN
ncbi:putative oxidoreductase [Hypomontagnella monticulosa]|nr:putative oxidoreductase [Hypomontagnella monticulosa]